ncbi:histidine kinase [Streptomyces sp. NPDC005483]|uniref:sensor histidine kinase n=1 Tax=Streptomyces sp. NPDC005483 TaxID=3154882 RepID=UPI0033A6D88F
MLQAGVALNGLIEMLTVGARGAAFVAWALCIPAMIGLQALHSPPTARRLRRFSVWTLVLQGVLTYLPCLAFHTLWPGMGGFVAGAGAAGLRGRRGTGAFLTVLVVDTSVSWRDGVPYTEAAVGLVVTLVVGLAVAALLRIACRLDWICRAEAQAVRNALQDERLRIGRDMHDLLASRLAFAAIRGELANRHLGRQNERARSELRSLLGLTREVLADMRSMAHEFGTLSLRCELDNARSLLESMGVTVNVREETAIPYGEIQNLFAAAVRESVTNILRHSEATQCTIVLRSKGETILLSVLNDGTHGTHRSASTGQGLANLAARASELGGRCRAWTPREGRFLVTVSCPASASTDRREAAIPPAVQCAPRPDGFAHQAS